MAVSWLTMQAFYEFLLSYGYPSVYLWVIPIAMVGTSIPLMFFGKTSWKVFTAIAGSGVGYLVGLTYVAPYIGITPWLIAFITAVILGIVLYFAVRIGVSGGIGYLVYLAMTTQTFYPFPQTVTIVAGGFNLHILYMDLAFAVAAMGAAFWLYGRLSMLIAGGLGALSMYMALSVYIPGQYAAIIAVILLTVGLWVQILMPKIRKRQLKKAQAKAEKLKREQQDLIKRGDADAAKS